MTISYDVEGTARLIGTNFWHEVRPVIPIDIDQPAMRVVVSVMFEASA